MIFMKWKNNLTEILKIDYPIVQAPMLGVTTPAMVAAIANNGALGSLPAGGLSPGKTLELVRKTKELTNKPFAVNLFAHTPEVANIRQVTAMQDFLEKLAGENKLVYQSQSVDTFHNYTYQEQIETLLAENIPVVSFTFGILDDESINALKANGTILIGTATTVREAKLLDEKGIDIITAQGIEAGGHRGTFLNDDPLPMIGLMALVPQIAKAVSKPILAAGAINDGATIRAAMLLGAKGVQIGTTFIPTEESAAKLSHKRALLNASEIDTVLTRAITGRWARGIRNELIKLVEQSGIEIPGYPTQLNLTSSLRQSAQKQDNKEFSSLWAGQSPSRSKEIKPVAIILAELIAQTEGVDKSF